MTPDQAADLAARTLAAIDAREYAEGNVPFDHGYFRERVASDLAGLRDVYEPHLPMEPGDALPARAARHARRYAAGLRRTAALYGVPSPCRSGHTDCTVDCGWCKGGTR